MARGNTGSSKIKAVSIYPKAQMSGTGGLVAKNNFRPAASGRGVSKARMPQHRSSK